MYLFLAVLGVCCCMGFFSSCGKWGPQSSPQCMGFSLSWLLLLQSMGSRHTNFSSCGLRSCSSQALDHRLNCRGPASGGSRGYPQDERRRRERERERRQVRLALIGPSLRDPLFMRVLYITFWPWGLLTFYAGQVNVNLFSVSMVTLTER